MTVVLQNTAGTYTALFHAAAIPTAASHTELIPTATCYIKASYNALSHVAVTQTSVYCTDNAYRVYPF